MNVGQAKQNLSNLLARVEAGEVVEIARDGVPVARLSRIEPATSGSRFLAARGSLAGRLSITDHFEFTEAELDEVDVRLLLDTHVVLWQLEGSGPLSPAARESIEQEATDVLFSVVSFAEIGVKAGDRQALGSARPAGARPAQRRPGPAARCRARLPRWRTCRGIIVTRSTGSSSRRPVPST